MNTKEITVLLIGRICSTKQQVEFVRQTYNKIDDNIKFYFAGTGEDVALLKKQIGFSKQYFYLGYRKAVEIIPQFDYVCLFSKNEGLPLSLIEGCMFGKPLITNNIDSVLDININNVTGFVFPDFNHLIRGLNRIPDKFSDEYSRMSSNARKQYEDKFTEAVMIDNYKRYINVSF